MSAACTRRTSRRVVSILAICALLSAGSLFSASAATAGSELWARRYDPAYWDKAYALGVSPDGSTVFVTGTSIAGTPTGEVGDYATVAYNAATGTRLWARRYDGPGNGLDDGYAIGVSPDGSIVFVTGASEGSTGSADYATLAYDASTGTKMWDTRYDGPVSGDDAAIALGVSPDGSATFVTGRSEASGGYADYATVAYDASTGTELWVARYSGPVNGYDAARALGVSPDGSTVFVTGGSRGPGGYGYDYATLAYDASNGSKLWAARYDGPGNGAAQASELGVSPDGSTVFVTGHSKGSTTRWDYATLAYDSATGTRLWAKRYGPPSVDDTATAIGVSPDGSAVFVTGSSRGSMTRSDYATLAYDASTGAKLWATRYDGPANDDDEAVGLGVSPDGSSVFVTGVSQGLGGYYGYATLAYAASTGTRLWGKRYNGSVNGYDAASALGVRPDGSAVFVTGTSWGGSAGRYDYDYATVAYAS
jgi:hypothetical protein